MIRQIILARRAPGVIPYARCFSSCPFQVLGLKNNRTSRPAPTPAHRLDHTITYEQVRIAFREQALEHHPDTKSGKNISSDQFTRIREAYDAIVEGPDGIAVLKDDHTYIDRYDESVKGAGKDNNNQSNTYEEEEQNEFLHPSVNPQVLHEVAEVVETLNPGGLDKGGMWAFANMIHRIAKDESKGLPPLRVGGGDDANAKDNDPRIRRRMRKRR